MDGHTHVLVLKQPSFVVLPVYVDDPWFDDKVLQVIEELKKALSRQKCAVRLAIAGISALVMLTATEVASVALSQSVQNSGSVNHLSKRFSITSETQ